MIPINIYTTCKNFIEQNQLDINIEQLLLLYEVSHYVMYFPTYRKHVNVLMKKRYLAYTDVVSSKVHVTQKGVRLLNKFKSFVQYNSNDEDASLIDTIVNN